MNWRTLNIGDKVKVIDEEDPKRIFAIVVVTKICDDHVMAAESDGIAYWIDDDTASLFRR